MNSNIRQFRDLGNMTPCELETVRKFLGDRMNEVEAEMQMRDHVDLGSGAMQVIPDRNGTTPEARQTFTWERPADVSDVWHLMRGEDLVCKVYYGEKGFYYNCNSYSSHPYNHLYEAQNAAEEFAFQNPNTYFIEPSVSLTGHGEPEPTWVKKMFGIWLFKYADDEKPHGERVVGSVFPLDNKFGAKFYVRNNEIQEKFSEISDAKKFVEMMVSGQNPQSQDEENPNVPPPHMVEEDVMRAKSEFLGNRTWTDRAAAENAVWFGGAVS